MRRLLRWLCTAALCCAILECPATSGAEGQPANANAPGGYGARFHDPQFNVIVGTVISTSRDEVNHLIAHHLRVLTDLRGSLKPAAVITVEGTDANTFKAPLNVPEFDAGSIVAISASATRDPERWEYVFVGTLPIGVDSTRPIPTQDLADITVAFRELQAALTAPDGAGPSRGRVDQLLHERNSYLWALGAWRLSKDADAADLKKLERLFLQPGLTAWQALWVDHLLDSVTGPAALDRPSPAERHMMLRRFLYNFVHAADGSGPPTTQPAR